MSPPHVLVVSPFRLYREGLCRVLHDHGSAEIIGALADLADWGVSTSVDSLDAVLIDAQLLDASGVHKLRKRTAHARIVAMSSVGTVDEAARCIRAGVDGILSRDATIGEILDVLDRIGRGDLPVPAHTAAALFKQLASHQSHQYSGLARLSQREHEITVLAASGLTDKKIAQRLGLKVSTVKNHLHNVFQKLAISRRSELAALFWSEQQNTR